MLFFVPAPWAGRAEGLVGAVQVIWYCIQRYLIRELNFVMTVHDEFTSSVNTVVCHNQPCGTVGGAHSNSGLNYVGPV